MSPINFTNSSGLTIQFTHNDLDLILTDLTAHETYFTCGNNDLVYVMLSPGNLLLVDTSSLINRKLFESFSFGASVLFPFQLKLTNNNTASVMSINEALISIGFNGITPISSLASIHMMVYVQSGSNVDVYSKAEVNQLILNLIDNAPTNLDTLQELALALQNEATQEQNDVASILTQIATKLNISNPSFTNTLKNANNSFSVDATGNLTCNNATFNGSVSGLTASEIAGLSDALALKAPLASPTFTGTVNGITKTMVGLSNVDNVADVNKTFTESQITGLVADLSSKQPLLSANSIPITYVSGLQASLNALQPTIGNGSLSIANTSGLQSALDSKAPQATTYTKTEVDTAIGSKAYTKSEVDTALALKAPQATTYTKAEIDLALAFKAPLSASISTDQLNTTISLYAPQATTYTKTEVDTALNLKAPQSTTYTKTEVDTALNLKAPQSTTYTKTEVDTIVGLKAPQSTTYTKTEVDTALALKAPQLTTYTKTEVDASLALKAPQSSTYTKTEVDTSLALKAPQSSTYTKTEVDTALALKAPQSNTYTKTEVDNALSTKAFSQSQVTGLTTALSNLQPIDLTNTLTNIPLSLNIPSNYFTGFPNDQPTWTASGAATSVNVFASQNYQLLTFPTTATSLSLTLSNDYPLIQCSLSVAVKRGTATAFPIRIKSGTTTLATQTFTGLSTTGYTVCTLNFTTPASGSMTVNIGAGAGSGAETGTVYTTNWCIYGGTSQINRFRGDISAPFGNATALDLLYGPNATSLISTLATLAPLNNPTFTGTINGITKLMVGLGNVDNTTDLSKPISTATQTALNLLLSIANPTYTGSLTGPSSKFTVDANGNLTAWSLTSSNNITCTDLLYAGGLSLSTKLSSLAPLSSSTSFSAGAITSLTTITSPACQINGNATITGDILLGLPQTYLSTTLTGKANLTGATFTGTISAPTINLNGTSVATTLSTLQPKLTNLNNINNVFNSANALMTNFTPVDQLAWTKSTGNYTNYDSTITNAWGYTENNVQQLTFATGTGSNYDLLFQIPATGYAGQTLIIKCWVKLGSTSNWNLSVNNSQVWNTVGGKTFTSSDGLNTTTYTQLSYSFVCPNTPSFTLHLGSNMNTLYGQTAQVAGTSYVYGWQIFVKGKQSLLESNLTVDGTVSTSDVLFSPQGYSLASAFAYINLRLTTTSVPQSATTDLAWALINNGYISIATSIITLPTIGTYIVGGKVYCTSTAVTAGSVQTMFATSTNGGSTWSFLNYGMCVAGGGDIPIYGFITTTVANQQCKICLFNGFTSAVTVSALYSNSFCYIYKVSP